MNPGSAASGATDGSRQLTAWVVKGGEEGQTVKHNLEHGVVTLGWGNWVADVDVATFEDKAALGRYIEQHVTGKERERMDRGLHEIWRFCNEIEIGDPVVLPLTNYGPPDHIAIGCVTGDAETDAGQDEDARLRRAVKWLAKEVSEAAAGSDLQRSIKHRGKTAFRPGATNAALRLLHLSRYVEDPGSDAAIDVEPVSGDPQQVPLSGDEAGVLVGDGGEVPEGAKTRVEVNRYERDSGARQRCLEHYDYTCQVCGLRFRERYGDFARNYMHVHHKTPLSQITDHEKHTVDPLIDLVAVCPHCHAMLHRHPDNPCSVEKLKSLMGRTPESTGGR